MGWLNMKVESVRSNNRITADDTIAKSSDICTVLFNTSKLHNCKLFSDTVTYNDLGVYGNLIHSRASTEQTVCHMMKLRIHCDDVLLAKIKAVLEHDTRHPRERNFSQQVVEQMELLAKIKAVSEHDTRHPQERNFLQQVVEQM